MPQMNAAWKFDEKYVMDEVNAFEAAKRRAHRDTKKIMPRGWSMRIGGSRDKKKGEWYIFWNVKFETCIDSINGVRRNNNAGVRVKVSWFPCSQESPSNDNYWIATSGTSHASVTHQDALEALKADIPSLKACMDRIMHHLASDPISNLIYSATAKEAEQA